MACHNKIIQFCLCFCFISKKKIGASIKAFDIRTNNVMHNVHVVSKLVFRVILHGLSGRCKDKNMILF